MATDNSSNRPVKYRPINGYPGYCVGDNGTVWRRWVTCRRGRVLTNKWRKMKLGVNTKGYHSVNLVPPEGGSYQTYRVHRLVLTAFVGPCPEGMECRHLNGVKTDNQLENLCWGTPAENYTDNHRMDVYGYGEQRAQAKLTNEQVQQIRELHATGQYLQRELAVQFGVSVSQISNIVNGKSRKRG